MLIRKIGVFCNTDSYSKKIYKKLINKLSCNGYSVDNDNFDLAIAIGGDGAFLKMVHECDFNDRVYYLGINTGTLGFAQEINPLEIDIFLQMLKDEKYQIENISIGITNIYVKDKEYHLKFLNEILIRQNDLKTINLDIHINKQLLENFRGDGILVATSFGTSAHNLSYGGSIVYSDLHVLELTPIAPLNSRSYRTLSNSVIIPEKREICIMSNDNSKNILLTCDGENYIYNDVEKIEITVKREKIKCLRMYNYDYTKRIYEKMIKG